MKIAFVMHVFDERADEVAINVAALKTFYPGAYIFLIYDGVSCQGHSDVIECEFDRVKIPGKFGTFTHRYLKLCLDKTDCDYIIKIDPDTRIWNTVSYLPDPTLQTIFCRMTYNYIPHGGALGYTRPMAKLLVDSGWLINERLLCRHADHPHQDPIHKELIWAKQLHVQVRHDFGWIGYETENTVFSHTGFRGKYVDDQHVRKNSKIIVDKHP